MEPLLSGPVAEHLLRDVLAPGDCQPSVGLEAIFDVAGWLANEHLPSRRLVSTRLLLFAVAELSLHPALEDGLDISAPERRAIRAAGQLMWDSQGFEAMYRDYFHPRTDAPNSSSKEPALSKNAHDLLVVLTDRPKPSDGRQAVVSAGDFLLVFPPGESFAQQLLREAEIEPDRFRGVVESALKELEVDSVATHRDEPAEEDELGRLAFAQVLADRIRDAQEADDEGKGAQSAFIVHLHGPWGSGKSSVLNFLEKELKADKWIVVKFNAWREQRLQPPWWSLITAIYGAALSKPRWRAPYLWLRWLGWRARADYAPLMAAVICLVGLLWLVLWLSPTADVTGNSLAPRAEITSVLDKLLKLAATAITVGAAIMLGSRSLVMGSRRAAQTYADIKTDPYRPITKLFRSLIDSIKRPVAVFVDDLDRCDEKYVVELLEGIQTLMRGAPVTYVIAADRKWICSSFEQRYKGFTPDIGEPGRPLGYLFLDKIFQISAAVPQLSDDLQASYWERLLKRSPSREGEDKIAPKLAQDKAVSDDRRSPSPVTDPETILDEARAEASRYTTHEQLRDFVTRAEARAAETGEKVFAQAARAAAARQITSACAAPDTRHRLRDFAPLLEPNPRAMKRLVNAYSMHQATLFLAGRDVTPDLLARWTILELRWPLLADFLAARPGSAEQLRNKLGEDDLPEAPKALRDLFGDEFVVKTIGEAGESSLTSAAIRLILGSHHER